MFLRFYPMVVDFSSISKKIACEYFWPKKTIFKNTRRFWNHGKKSILGAHFHPSSIFKSSSIKNDSSIFNYSSIKVINWSNFVSNRSIRPIEIPKKTTLYVFIAIYKSSSTFNGHLWCYINSTNLINLWWFYFLKVISLLENQFNNINSALLNILLVCIKQVIYLSDSESDKFQSHRRLHVRSYSTFIMLSYVFLFSCGFSIDFHYHYKEFIQH